MNSAYQQIVDYFAQQGWTFYQHVGQPILILHFQGENSCWTCRTLAREDVVVFLSEFPSRATLAQRSTCAELLTRLNFGLKHSCYELDFESGLIRLRTSQMIGVAGLTLQDIGNVVSTNLCVFNFHYRVIMRVLHGGVTPKLALHDEANKKVVEPVTARRFEIN